MERGAWRVAQRVHGGVCRGRMEGCAEGLPLATIDLMGDNREFEV